MWRLDDKGLMKLKELQLIFHKELDTIYGMEEVKSFFFILTQKYCNLSRLEFALEKSFFVTETERVLMISALQELKNEKPIQYIIGEAEFFALPFKVNKCVLIPRPETEELVNWVIEELKSKIQNSIPKKLQILDIGTGSGCIAISIAKNIPNTNVYALDVSQDALVIAKQNAEINDVVIEFVQLDILNSEIWNQEFEGIEFDIIVSNPPYVRKQEMLKMKANVVENEPHLALFVDDDNPLIFYKKIIEFGANYLKAKGKLFFEINEFLGNETIHLLEKHNFNSIELKQDIFNKDRCIKAVK